MNPKKQLTVSDKLKKLETVNWFKSRFKGQVTDKYLFNQAQLKEQESMKLVFKSLDKDHSNGLDREELQQMFEKFGIHISRKDLKKFFRVINQNEDDTIDWSEFKNALTNEEVTQTFIDIMRKLKNSHEENFNYLPTTFPKMVQYVNYCDLREDLIETIQKDEQGAMFKFKKCQELLSLNDKWYSNKLNDKTNFESTDKQQLNHRPSSLSVGTFNPGNIKKKQLEILHKQTRQVIYLLQVINTIKADTVLKSSLERKDSIGITSQTQPSNLQPKPLPTGQKLKNKFENHISQAQYKYALLVGSLQDQISPSLETEPLGQIDPYQLNRIQQTEQKQYIQSNPIFLPTKVLDNQNETPSHLKLITQKQTNKIKNTNGYKQINLTQIEHVSQPELIQLNQSQNENKINFVSPPRLSNKIRGRQKTTTNKNLRYKESLNFSAPYLIDANTQNEKKKKSISPNVKIQNLNQKLYQINERRYSFIKKSIDNSSIPYKSNLLKPQQVNSYGYHIDLPKPRTQIQTQVTNQSYGSNQSIYNIFKPHLKTTKTSTEIKENKVN